MRIVVRMAGILGARELVPITSSHIDGCLYHGDGGVEFAERLVELGGRVAVPATLNVGALDLCTGAGARRGRPARWPAAQMGYQGWGHADVDPARRNQQGTGRAGEHTDL